MNRDSNVSGLFGVLESVRMILGGVPEDVTGVEEGVFVAAFQVREGSMG